MNRVLKLDRVRVAMEALGLSRDHWSPCHLVFSATAADRLKFTPWEYVASLTGQALDELDDRLRMRLVAEQAADIDPELKKVTPHLGTEIMYRHGPAGGE